MINLIKRIVNFIDYFYSSYMILMCVLIISIMICIKHLVYDPTYLLGPLGVITIQITLLTCYLLSIRRKNKY